MYTYIRTSHIAFASSQLSSQSAPLSIETFLLAWLFCPVVSNAPSTNAGHTVIILHSVFFGFCRLTVNRPARLPPSLYVEIKLHWSIRSLDSSCRHLNERILKFGATNYADQYNSAIWRHSAFWGYCYRKFKIPISVSAFDSGTLKEIARGTYNNGTRIKLYFQL